MAKTYPIQQSFSAGEISPKLLARSDLNGYKHSALELLNMIPSIQGPAGSRPGFKWVGQADVGEQYARMMPFHVSFGEAYAIIVTVDFVYVVDRNGQQPANNLLLNANFSAAGADWNVDAPGAATVIFTSGVCVLSSAGGLPAAIWQSVTTAEPLENHHVVANGIAPGAMRILIGTVQGTGDILDEVFVGEDAKFSYIPGVANYFVQFQVEDDNTKTLDDVATYALIDPSTEFIRFASPWATAAQIEDIQFEMEPGRNKMYMFQRDIEPQMLEYTGAHDWTFGRIDFTTDIDSGVEPTEGPWGTDYPGSIAFFKGRMYVGGTRLQPVAIWASKPGIFFNFTLGGEDNSEDAMFLPLDRNGDIQWMRGGKALFAGMDTGEHIIFSSTGEVPDVQNVDTEQQSAFGSSRVQAVLLGEKVAYVTPDRRKVYLTAYVRDSLGWDSEDVSYPSEHITAGRLREIESTVTPDQILWFPTLDGKLVGMIYDARRNIIGWHRHETDGFIVSITVLKAFGVQQLWVAVLRNGILHFERSSITDAQMDSFVDQTAITPQTIFPGFDHLIGNTVQVLADGAIHRDVVVAGDGTITLDYVAERVVAGLKFTARIRTVPVDMLTQDESRTSFLKSWNKIFIRMLNSARPLINGVRPPVRNELTPMGEAEPLRTEDLEVSNLGWDLYASITIEQDLPLKLEVSGVFGELDQENIS